MSRVPALMAMSLGFLLADPSGSFGTKGTTAPGPEDPAPTTSKVPIARWTAPDKRPQYVRDVDCWVSAVDVPRAHLEDTITLSVVNLDAYVKWAIEGDGSTTRDRQLNNLVLFLNDRPLSGIRPSIVNDPTEQESATRGQAYLFPVHKLPFRLTRTKESNAAWQELLDRPVLERPVNVSVGFDDLPPVVTLVQRDGDTRTTVPFSLIVLPLDLWTFGGVALVLGSLWLFLRLSARTDLIRDPTSPMRPDGRYPFSLARAQMAFWFFLVFATYFLIWIITGAKDSITQSILALTGISAATAVGSAIVDVRRPGLADEMSANDARTDRCNRAVDLKKEIAALEAGSSPFDTRLAQATTPEEQVAIRKAKAERLMHARVAYDYCRQPPWQNFMTDLLSEGGLVSFHRFQIFIWTIVLGIIFLKEVYNKLSMPEFNGTLLGLMGVSSGTYVALKLPAAKATASGAP